MFSVVDGDVRWRAWSQTPVVGVGYRSDGDRYLSILVAAFHR